VKGFDATGCFECITERFHVCVNVSWSEFFADSKKFVTKKKLRRVECVNFLCAAIGNKKKNTTPVPKYNYAV